MVPRHRAQVFGIGLPKTGTTTLGAMLRRLGYHHAPYDEALIQSVVDGDRDAMWSCVDAHQSFEDWPWPAVYRELDSRLPDALFVLTVRRDAQSWLTSNQRHEELNIAHYGLALRHPKLKAAQQLSERLWGTANPLEQPERFVEAYDRHNRDARTHFAGRAGKLVELCWEIGDGWPELCAFLDHPVVEGPVPHENTAESRARRLKPPLWRRGLRWAANQIRA